MWSFTEYDNVLLQEKDGDVDDDEDMTQFLSKLFDFLLKVNLSLVKPFRFVCTMTCVADSVRKDVSSAESRCRQQRGALQMLPAD